MRIRSFIIAYALVLAILLFADRRPGSQQQPRYSHVVDLTEGDSSSVASSHGVRAETRTRIIAPGTLIPGTWGPGQIPAERLIAPLVVVDLSASGHPLSLDDISAWESKHGMIPQGAVLAVRQVSARSPATRDFPVEREAAQFLVESRYTIGFTVETSVEFVSDRTLARQLALRGAYVVENATHFAALPPLGSLVIVAPEKNNQSGQTPVRVLAMVR